MKQCMYCKAEIEEKSKVCPACGKKQVQVYTQTFYRNGNSESAFIQKINEWFAQYPQVANVHGDFRTNESLGLFVNKYNLNALAIQYECLSGENIYQYAVVSLAHFGLMPKKTNQLLADWQEANPGAIIVGRGGGIHQRGDVGSLAFGGIMAANYSQLYLLFKFDRKTGPGVKANRD